MRDDLLRALDNLNKAEALARGSDQFGDASQAAEKVESFIPPDAPVYSVLSGGNIMLLSIGVLVLSTNLTGSRITGSEIVAFRDIRGVRVQPMKNTFDPYWYVILDRQESAQLGKKALPRISGLTNSHEHAQAFQAKASELLNGGAFVNSQPSAPEPSALDKIAQLKSLLDAGAITRAEFDAKKDQLLGEV